MRQIPRDGFFDGNGLIRVVASGILLTGLAGTASAADHRVSAQTATFNCASVRGGDTVTLASGTRGPLTIRGCNASASNPITVRNDPNGSGPTVIQRSSGGHGGFVFTCASCIGVVIDGTQRWAGAPSENTYGIKVTQSGSGGPSAFLKISGMSRFVTIRGVEIDGKWPSQSGNGIGISVNDHKVTARANPNSWFEGITIENNYVHNVQGEGLYIGPNWYQGGLPLRDIEIANNLIEDTGWEGIQLKSAVGGENSIHHNVIRRVGKSVSHGQLAGISLLDGSGRIYNNWVERVGDTGIRHFLQHLPSSYGTQTVEVYNNVVVESGLVATTPGHGIASNSKNGAARPMARIYNNTVVNAKDSGIYIGGQASGGFVRDNLIANATEKPISAPSSVEEINNRVGSTGQMGFVNPGELNFRLVSHSPARNAGSSSYPHSDFDDTARPQDGQADQGAFEFRIGGTSAMQPKAPAALSVE
jgi:hypothetical protein